MSRAEYLEGNKDEWIMGVGFFFFKVVMKYSKIDFRDCRTPL